MKDVFEHPFIELPIMEGGKTSVRPEVQQHLYALWQEYLGKEVEKEFDILVKRLEKIEGLKQENWEHLSYREREEVLRRVHREMAEVYRFPEARVEFVTLPPKIFGGANGRRILINRALLEKNSPAEAVKTLLHESRHAYQFYISNQPEGKIPPDRRGEVKEWRENLQRYRDPRRWGFAEYYSQPLEVDARRFATDVCRKLGYS